MHTCSETQRQLREADMIYSKGVWGAVIWQIHQDPITVWKKKGPASTRVRRLLWVGRRRELALTQHWV